MLIDIQALLIGELVIQILSKHLYPFEQHYLHS
jgi:hypothetical protein